jgi:lysine-ketoglutarate reductase/saccharopine dehydrogenase-like protein (TIGR00300 family)
LCSKLRRSSQPTDLAMRTEILILEGHIIDSRTLPRLLDLIIAGGCDYELLEVEVGKTEADSSRARIEVRGDSATVDKILVEALAIGAYVPDTGDAQLDAATIDGVFPEGFYATTNLPTQVRIDGTWLDVAQPEMDCGIVVADGKARTIAMSDIRLGDQIVVGYGGVKVQPLERPRGSSGVFSFMSSEVSSEKPQALLIEQIAATARATREAGRKICWVLGPAVVHTGSAGDLVRMINSGWVDVVFAGNALATHDCEANVYGTSLGVNLSQGAPVEHGHEHHLRTINRVRAAGSFEAAVEKGILTSGIMHALVTHQIPYVLAGSVRDDGPMPGVITDMLEAQRAMRAHVGSLGMAIMVSTMLHSIATGNMLPSSVATVCVDINPSAVTKLIDRGSIQSIGMVTDVGLFLRQLADALGA